MPPQSFLSHLLRKVAILSCIVPAPSVVSGIPSQMLKWRREQQSQVLSRSKINPIPFQIPKLLLRLPPPRSQHLPLPVRCESVSFFPFSRKAAAARVGNGQGPRESRKEGERRDAFPNIGPPIPPPLPFFKAREFFRMLPPRLPLCMLLPRILLLLSVLLWTVQGQRGRGPNVEGRERGRRNKCGKRWRKKCAL